MASPGQVCGVDHAEASVAASLRLNTKAVAQGQVEVRKGSVSELPWAENTFDVATAVETHFFWPNLQSDTAEVLRVLKPGGTLALIAEVYKGAGTRRGELIDKYMPQTGMALLTVEEHRTLLEGAGFTEVQVDADPQRVWICACARKPQS
jgi:ubiquinone/menaquinone biosynthesis C-methylase UbiE